MNAVDLKSAVEDRKADWFTVLLLRLIMKSDRDRRRRLALAYPTEVEAVNIFQNECLYMADIVESKKTRSGMEVVNHRPDYDAIVALAEKRTGELDTDNPVIGLSRWQQDEARQVRKFGDWWSEQVSKEPEHFPVAMPVGEWDEQYRLWTS